MSFLRAYKRIDSLSDVFYFYTTGGSNDGQTKYVVAATAEAEGSTISKAP